MAYSPTLPPAVIAQQIDNVFAPKLWVMGGFDTVDIVTAIGYVTNGKSLKLNVGDIVLYVLFGAPPIPYFLIVTSTNPDDSVNLGIGLTGSNPDPSGNPRWVTGTGESVVDGSGESIIL